MKKVLITVIIVVLIIPVVFGISSRNPGNGSFQMPALAVVVKGKITSDSTGDPIIHHAVLITVEALGYSSTRFTDIDGYYTDTISDGGIGNTVVVSTLDCHQIVHSQSFLIISTLVVINFEICYHPPAECRAVFSLVLDSANRESNTFIFSNNSTGNPDHWYWHFGDGTTSNEKNPIHRYMESGDYNVCLRVAREEGGTAVCTDSICHALSTATYRNLGGHLFAGGQPINNPVSTGDTGIVFLYRMYNNRVIPLDTNVFTNLGYYSFPQVLQGDYLVRAELSKGSARYSAYFPGYPAQSITWTGAELIYLDDSNSFNAHIYMLPCQETFAGPAAISGKITGGEPGSSGAAIPFAEVILYDSQLVPLRYTKADNLGNFVFDDLPHGHYALYVEYPGKYSRITGVSLESPVTLADSIQLGLFDHNVTGIGDMPANDSFTVRLFPNPVSEELHAITWLSHNAKVIFTVFNLTGQKVLCLTAEVRTGECHSAIPATGLRPGIYLLQSISSDGLLVNIQKFVKN